MHMTPPDFQPREAMAKLFRITKSTRIAGAALAALPNECAEHINRNVPIDDCIPLHTLICRAFKRIKAEPYVQTKLPFIKLQTKTEMAALPVTECNIYCTAQPMNVRFK